MQDYFDCPAMEAKDRNDNKITEKSLETFEKKLAPLRGEICRRQSGESSNEFAKTKKFTIGVDIFGYVTETFKISTSQKSALTNV